MKKNKKNKRIWELVEKGKSYWWWITKGNRKYIRDEKGNWNLKDPDELGGEG